MKTLRISRPNSAFQILSALKTNRNKRHREGLFLVESVAAVKMMLKKGMTAAGVLVTDGKKLSGWAEEAVRQLFPETSYVLSADLMEQLSDKENTSELIVLAGIAATRLDDLNLPADPLIVVIDRPSNPGNLGTILRTSDAFGVNAVVTTGHAADIYDPLTVRASLGAVFSVPVVYEPNKASLTEWMKSLRQGRPGMSITGTDSGAETVLGPGVLRRPLILCLGNEAAGLSDKMKAIVDRTVSIPMRGSVDSLNVASAAAVLLLAAVDALPSRVRSGSANDTLDGDEPA